VSLNNVDHIALNSNDPIASADWYAEEFGGSIVYSDESWSMVEFENIKLSFVIPGSHPSHIAFEVESFGCNDIVKEHRDGSSSCYKKDEWGNIYELISYKKEG
tara:strand:+ start:2264 stop:2572 length:309 start_codon:yes stop_codon:yes gene_type:complete